MEQEIHITLRYHLAIGKVNLNEIVYQLQKLQNLLMLEILKQILGSYDHLISERLSTVQSIPPSKACKEILTLVVYLFRNVPIFPQGLLL